MTASIQIFSLPFCLHLSRVAQKNLNRAEKESDWFTVNGSRKNLCDVENCTILYIFSTLLLHIWCDMWQIIWAVKPASDFR